MSADNLSEDSEGECGGFFLARLGSVANFEKCRNYRSRGASATSPAAGSDCLSEWISNGMTLTLVSDEAPDTGDDSDEDLITSYLGGDHAHHAGALGGPYGGGGGDAIPAINITGNSSNSNHILGT